MEHEELSKLVEKFDEELKSRNISRRDAIKLAALSSAMFLLTPNSSVAATSAKAAGKGANILIVGAGAAGCSIASFLSKNIDDIKITIIEPNPKSVRYQPGQTLIGAGVWEKEDIMGNTADYLPSSVKWIQDKVSEFDPDNNKVTTEKNGQIDYDFMVVAAGLELNYEVIDGMSRDLVGKNGISSVYFADGAVKTWKLIQEFMESAKNKKDLKAIYTQPNTPIKCGGAPKKMAFLTHARFRDANLRDNISIDFYPSGGKFFGVKEYNEATKKYFKARNMNYHFGNNLVAIEPEAKKATFENKDGRFDLEYDFIHVVPPMSAPKAVKNSNLGFSEGKLVSGGWIDVSKDTMQHSRYKNIFALGDVAGLPTSKSAAAVREEYKICGKNLISVIKGKEPKEIYDGYTACPLITDLGKVMMAEFNYKKEMSPKLPFLDPAQERWLWWFVKVYMLKPMYFHLMLTSRG